MVDLKLQVPVKDEVEVSLETLAAIDRGIANADNGRAVPIKEVRKLIQSGFPNSNRREAALADTAAR